MGRAAFTGTGCGVKGITTTITAVAVVPAPNISWLVCSHRRRGAFPPHLTRH